MTPAAIAAHWTRKTSLLAIDPGARTGWALFIELAGVFRLSACGVASPTEPPTWPGMKKIDQVVIENPVIYPNQKARPKDILTLARIVGRYQERFDASPIELVEPREWKGSIDGDVMIHRIEGAFDAGDKRIVDTYLSKMSTTNRGNAIDAIGLGKWALRQPFMKGPHQRAT